MRYSAPQIPHLAERILRLVITNGNFLERLGDLEETYVDMLDARGFFLARGWLWGQIFKLALKAVRKHFSRTLAMTFHSLRSAWRNLARHKGFTTLNISGLTIGFFCFIGIFLFIQHEYSFDRQYPKAARIYRTVFKFTEDAAMGTPKRAHSHPLLAPTLLREFPEIEDATRFSKYHEVFIRVEDHPFIIDKWVWADEHIFNIFDLPLLAGDPATALARPFSAVIDEETALRLFGPVYPIGKTFELVNGKVFTMTVTGVMKNLPARSHFRPLCLGQFDTQSRMGWSRTLNSWDARWFHSYLLLKENCDARNLEAKIQLFLQEKIHPLGSSTNWTYILQPLPDIHLRSTDILNQLEAGGDIESVRICSLIAFMILILAGINFINLSTSRSLARLRDIGIRKVIGATRIQLAGIFFGESMIAVFFSLLFAAGFALLSLKGLSGLVNRQLSAQSLAHPGFVAGLIAASVAMGLLSGFYPALHLSRIQPLIGLRGALLRPFKRSNPRNVLVVFQFAISLFLIIGTLVISRQIQMFRTKKLGFNRDHVVVIHLAADKIREQREIFRNQLLRNPGIKGLTFTQTLPININWDSDFDYEDRGTRELPTFYFALVDYDYVKVFDMEIIKGRDFCREISTDSQGGGAFIINESAARQMGWEDPIGKKIGFPGGENMGTVIGMVKDFNSHSLHLPAEPAVLVLNGTGGNLYFLSIKVAPDNIDRAIEAIEKAWLEHSGGYPFEFGFLDAAYDDLYKSERRLGGLFRLFTLIALSISCLGLIGLASAATARRTKEIGIRKSLGASASGIVLLLSREFVKWVLLSNLIAWPVAYYFMSAWLRNFAYRIHLNIWIFVLSGTAAVLIALLTIGYQAVQAATADPVGTLRRE